MGYGHAKGKYFFYRSWKHEACHMIRWFYNNATTKTISMPNEVKVIYYYTISAYVREDWGFYSTYAAYSQMFAGAHYTNLLRRDLAQRSYKCLVNHVCKLEIISVAEAVMVEIMTSMVKGHVLYIFVLSWELIKASS